MSLGTACPSYLYTRIAAWIHEVALAQSGTDAPVFPSGVDATPLTDTDDASSTWCPSLGDEESDLEIHFEVALSDSGSLDDGVPWVPDAPPAGLTFPVSDARNSRPDTDPISERARVALYTACDEEPFVVVAGDVHTLHVKASHRGDHVRDTASAWKTFAFTKKIVIRKGQGAVEQRSVNDSGSGELTQYSSDDENDVPEITPEQVSAAEILVSFRAGYCNPTSEQVSAAEILVSFSAGYRNGSGADESTQHSSDDESNIPEFTPQETYTMEVLKLRRAADRSSVGSGADRSAQYCTMPSGRGERPFITEGPNFEFYMKLWDRAAAEEACMGDPWKHSVFVRMNMSWQTEGDIRAPVEDYTSGNETEGTHTGALALSTKSEIPSLGRPWEL